MLGANHRQDRACDRLDIHLREVGGVYLDDWSIQRQRIEASAQEHQLKLRHVPQIVMPWMPLIRGCAQTKALQQYRAIGDAAA